MYLGALGSLLTRRSAGMFSRPAIGATAARPTRSFHTHRDLAIHSGPFFYVAMAGMGLGGFLYYLKKGKDESALLHVHELYITDFIIFVAGKLTHGENSKEVCVVDAFDPKLYGKRSTKEYDETAMKEKFEQWMKQYNRTYRTEEEKAFRYERFKIACWHVENPNRFGDWTADECERYHCCGGIDLEQYNAEINSLIAEGGIDGISDEEDRRPPPSG
ncbi:hypothetical protein EJB05_03060 [Eragrostis curvula]|uniref:Cathepsin propeptide inhibitor domain-containing protein n=1 Tax=Eragrostis curvula TaxID=38414 RepID=A0A5J9WX65_9POAL|nr:hypothetical protein EJB05_03060 [Eragrostis curvula]